MNGEGIPSTRAGVGAAAPPAGTPGLAGTGDGESGRDDLRYLEDPRAMIPGNRVRLLHNGEQIFPAWRAAIDAARERVSLEMYIFNDDPIGRVFAEALSQAARRGVMVRLLYDYVGCRMTPANFFQTMRDAGVRVAVYHAYRGWRPRIWSLFRRNHRKSLIVDGRVAFTGGLNISNEWVPASQGGDDWRDAVIEVQGPAVRAIETAFATTWNRRAGKAFQLDPDAPGDGGPAANAAAGPAPTAAPAGATAVAVLTNSERGDRFVIRQAALHAMRESRRRIYLANPYFVPDGGVLRALRHAARRGVDVRILIPDESDSLILDAAARATFHRLLTAGARIWQSRAVTHTKAVLVDDVFVSIGSYNLDHWSLAYNLEMVVNVIDRAFNAAVAAMLEFERGGSVELELGAVEGRPLLLRLVDRLAHAFRQWL